MARRPGRLRPATNVRQDLLAAWLTQNAALLPPNGSKEVTQRIKTHVKYAAEWFDDIPRTVAVGRGSLVGWTAEPICAYGDPVDLFMQLLDRVAPLGIEVHAVTRRILQDPLHASALAEAGVPVGESKYTIDYYTRMDGGGSRLLAALSDAVRDSVAEDPASVRSLVGPSANPAALVAAVSQRAEAQVVQQAAQDCAAAASKDGIAPGPALAQGASLCGRECPPGRRLVDVRPEEFSNELAELNSRWIKTGHNDAMDRAMAARFAHTLVDPEFYLPAREDVVTEFLTRAPRSLAAAARRLGISVADERELVSLSVEKGWARLVHVFCDAYLDPDREPGDWSHEVRKAINLRGAQDLFTQRLKEDGTDDAATSGKYTAVSSYAPWEPDYYSPSPIDRVELDFWLTRDLHLTRSSGYAELTRSILTLRDPGRAIKEIVWLADLLTSDSDRELSAPTSRPPLTPDEQDKLRTLINGRLGSALTDGYRRVASTQAEAGVRGELGALFSGIDFVQLCRDCHPDQSDDNDNVRVGSVVERAVKRAAIVVYGRRALDKDV